ncbi:hypothetical protein Hanom_Chr06g00483561 [Helianthus anomalus]
MRETRVFICSEVKKSFCTIIQMCNQTALYCFSTYWFRPSYPFIPLIHSTLIGSDVAKQPLSVLYIKRCWFYIFTNPKFFVII